MNTVNIKKLDINTIKKNSVCVIIGKRANGKTTLIKDLLLNNNDIKNILTVNIISPLETCTKDYKYTLPYGSTYNEYSEELLSNIIQNSRFFCDKHKCIMSKESTLVLDDAIIKSIKNDNGIKNIFLNGGHHYKMTTILSISHPLDLSQQLISNIDYLFIFKNNTNSSRQNLYERFDKYGCIFSSFHIFSSIMDSLNDHECLIIDMCVISNKIEDCVFWYKANIYHEANNKRKFQDTDDECNKRTKNNNDDLNNKRKYQDTDIDIDNEIIKKNKIEINESYNKFIVTDGKGGFKFST